MNYSETAPDERGATQAVQESGEESTPLLGRRGNTENGGTSSALKFILMCGFNSFVADWVYEGSRSILGPYLLLLGADALAISVISGFGEFLGYALRLISGRSADRTGLYWPITIAGYILQMVAVPLLSLARSWQVAGILIILERVGKATRSPPLKAMLSHAAKSMGFGWAFGIHEAMDQIGALFGPLFVALLLKVKHENYQFTFAMLAAPAVVMLLGVAVARLVYPHPENLESESPVQDTDKLPRVFWIYLLASSLVGAGFADFPVMAYKFRRTGDLSDEFIPVVYAISMAVAGAGSLAFGRLFDRFGLNLLALLTLIAAAYAPLVFLGRGHTLGIIGSCFWGLGTGVHESIIPAAVAPMVGPGRRASAYGLFTAIYGVSWFLGSTVIGLLFNRWMPAVVIFSVGLQLAAIPLIVYASRLISQSRASTGTEEEPFLEPSDI
ncbi:uncharacterized protein A1O5_12052 [Cladophialophora psammophila CBS 110553]|uniref:Major facilitator superfamily (MFS) profile domain-containing protein n=1 Tax=Cladophialophora psammophila CBS 110553 TaxID=1182543 RepID=W9W8D3_9EURO|nr:uncharacterized protein A1O5_12052 [Cladophialophora psammophila CBS 110553]EXJ61260.1 hypothetical protein A1O5_12052 [Cladophialophora psammophila CBS 110553]